MNKVLIFCTLCLLTLSLNAQGYGGEIKLKITYNDRPLVGYTITGSINDIDIGGKGVTDRHGNVTLHSDPLPIPNIDVKGVSNCGNTTREWEASGFVYVSPSENNYFHLRLDQVVKQMSEMSGLDMSMIMASFGLNCDGALGSKDDGRVPHPGSGQSAPSTSSTSSGSATAGTSGSTNSGGSTFGSSSKDEDDDEWDKKVAANRAEMDKDFADWEAKNDAKREQQRKETEQFHDDVHSGKMREDGLINKRAALMNAIERIDEKMAKNEEKLAKGKIKVKDVQDLKYEQKELAIEKKIKQNKLDRTNAEIARDYGFLPKAEKQRYKDREDQLEAELDQVKEDRKNGKPLNGASVNESVKTGGSETVVEKEVAPDPNEPKIDGKPISTLSERDLKTERLSLRSKKSKLVLKLKTKGKNMTDDEKAAIEKEIDEIQVLIDAVNERLD